MKIDKEDFNNTTDYVWCMEAVVLFRMTTEGCVSALIHLHHWYHFEKVGNGGSGRLKTFPFIILQVGRGKKWLTTCENSSISKFFTFLGLATVEVLKSNLVWPSKKRYQMEPRREVISGHKSLQCWATGWIFATVLHHVVFLLYVVKMFWCFARYKWLDVQECVLLFQTAAFPHQLL